MVPSFPEWEERDGGFGGENVLSAAYLEIPECNRSDFRAGNSNAFSAVAIISPTFGIDNWILPDRLVVCRETTYQWEHLVLQSVQ